MKKKYPKYRTSSGAESANMRFGARFMNGYSWLSIPVTEMAILAL